MAEQSNRGKWNFVHYLENNCAKRGEVGDVDGRCSLFFYKWHNTGESFWMRSAHFSPIIMQVRHGFRETMDGNIEASATLSPFTPLTLKSGVTTANLSSSAPILINIKVKQN